MRYRYFIIAFLICCTASAQYKGLDTLYVKPGSIGIEGGITFPILDYAATDNRLAASYAQPGYLIRVSMGYDIVSYLGVKISYINFQNATDVKELSKDIRSDLVRQGGMLNYISTGSYAAQGAMAGLYYPVRTFKTTFELRALAGIINSVYPYTEISYFDPFYNTNRKDIYLDAEANNLGFNLGVGFRHTLRPSLLITGGADFYYSEQTFSNRTVHLQLGPFTRIIRPDDFTQYYHVLLFSLGLAYAFD